MTRKQWLKGEQRLTAYRWLRHSIESPNLTDDYWHDYDGNLWVVDVLDDGTAVTHSLQD